LLPRSTRTAHEHTHAVLSSPSAPADGRKNQRSNIPVPLIADINITGRPHGGSGLDCFRKGRHKVEPYSLVFTSCVGRLSAPKPTADPAPLPSRPPRRSERRPALPCSRR
jgi:hypothetical protein